MYNEICTHLVLISKAEMPVAKYKVILIIVVAMATEMEAKIKCWLTLRQYLVTMATR